VLVGLSDLRPLTKGKVGIRDVARKVGYSTTVVSPPALVVRESTGPVRGALRPAV
jgi:hypothetical protein